ncbi:MAG: ankyrin repeat domain-containing protein [bacterium]|nr:ankyrin repeat domain-containing protein [bacterium]
MAAKEVPRVERGNENVPIRPAKDIGPLIDRIERVLDVKRDLDNLLWAAIISKEAGNVKRLLRHGVDPNFKDDYLMTPLMTAVEAGDHEIIGLLLDAGAGTDEKNTGGWSAFMYAADSGDLRMLETLIVLKADVNITNSFGETALMRAVMQEKKDVVEFLLRNNADVDMQDDKGNTALDHARMFNHPEIAELIERKARM